MGSFISELRNEYSSLFLTVLICGLSLKAVSGFGAVLEGCLLTEGVALEQAASLLSLVPEPVGGCPLGGRGTTANVLIPGCQLCGWWAAGTGRGRGMAPPGPRGWLPWQQTAENPSK